jgi:hypothetical protein
MSRDRLPFHRDVSIPTPSPGVPPKNVPPQFVNSADETILYPCLRVEIPEIKEHRLGGLPPRVALPASVKTADVQRDGRFGSLQTAKGDRLAEPCVGTPDWCVLTTRQCVSRSDPCR